MVEEFTNPELLAFPVEFSSHDESFPSQARLYFAGRAAVMHGVGDQWTRKHPKSSEKATPKVGWSADERLPKARDLRLSMFGGSRVVNNHIGLAAL